MSESILPMEYMSLTHSPGLSLFDFSASWHAAMTSSAWGFMASAQSLQMSFKAMDAQRARSGSLRADVTIGATMGRRVECMASHSAKPPMQSRAEETTRILLLYGSIGSLARNWVSTGHSSSSSASDSARQKSNVVYLPPLFNNMFCQFVIPYQINTSSVLNKPHFFGSISR